MVFAFGPRICLAAASYALAASSAVSKVPSHNLAPRFGSRISAAQLSIAQKVVKNCQYPRKARKARRPEASRVFTLTASSRRDHDHHRSRSTYLPHGRCLTPRYCDVVAFFDCLSPFPSCVARKAPVSHPSRPAAPPPPSQRTRARPCPTSTHAPIARATSTPLPSSIRRPSPCAPRPRPSPPRPQPARARPRHPTSLFPPSLAHLVRDIDVVEIDLGVHVRGRFTTTTARHRARRARRFTTRRRVRIPTRTSPARRVVRRPRDRARSRARRSRTIARAEGPRRRARGFDATRNSTRRAHGVGPTSSSRHDNTFRRSEMCACRVYRVIRTLRVVTRRSLVGSYRVWKHNVIRLVGPRCVNMYRVRVIRTLRVVTRRSLVIDRCVLCT